MSASTCARCGQALLPELVREIGKGTQCPFCAAPLPGASATAPPSAPPRVPPPARPAAVRAPTATLIGHGGPAVAKRAPEPGSAAETGPPEKHDWFRAPATPAPATAAAPSGARKTGTFAAAPIVSAPAVAPVAASSPPFVVPRASASMPAVGPTGAAVAAARLSASLPAQPRSSGPMAVVAAVPARVTATFETELLIGPERRRRRLIVAGVGGAIVLAASIGLATRAARRAPAAPPPPLNAAATGPAPVVKPLPPAPAAPAATVARPSPAAATDRPPTRRHGADEPVAADAPTKSRAHAARTVAEQPHERVRREPRASRANARHATHERHQHAVAITHAGARATAADAPAAHAAYQRGNGLLLGGNAAGAVAAYEEAVHLAPAAPEGYRGLGLAYEKQGNVDEATRAFRRYLKLAPRSRDRELVARRLQRLVHPDVDDAR